MISDARFVLYAALTLRNGEEMGPDAAQTSRLHETSNRQQVGRREREPLSSADDCGEAVRALLDKAGRFPILIQDHKGRCVDPADGCAGLCVDSMSRAYRGGPSHPEDRVRSMHQCGNRQELFRTSLVSH